MTSKKKKVSRLASVTDWLKAVALLLAATTMVAKELRQLVAEATKTECAVALPAAAKLTD